MGSHQAPSTRLPRRVKVANTLMPMATSVQTFHVSRRHIVCRNAGGRGGKPAATGRCRRRVSRWVCRSRLFRKGLWHEYVCKLWKYCALRFHLSLLCASRLRGLRFFQWFYCVRILIALVWNRRRERSTLTKGSNLSRRFKVSFNLLWSWPGR